MDRKGIQLVYTNKAYSFIYLEEKIMKVITVKNQLEGAKIGLDIVSEKWQQVLKHLA